MEFSLEGVWGRPESTTTQRKKLSTFVSFSVTLGSIWNEFSEERRRQSRGKSREIEGERTYVLQPQPKPILLALRPTLPLLFRAEVDPFVSTVRTVRHAETPVFERGGGVGWWGVGVVLEGRGRGSLFEVKDEGSARQHGGKRRR